MDVFSDKRTTVISEYKVNPTAEKIVNTIANVILVVGIIAGIILLWVGITLKREYNLDAYEIYGIIILITIIVIIASLVQWAFLKVYINISRNLYNVNAILKSLFPETTLTNQNQTKKFTIGQHVISKADQTSFRINSVNSRDGKYFYWSEKFQKEYSEEEIEAYDEYWAKKNKTT